MTDDYARLLDLARLQAELVADGRLAELDALAGQWERIVAALPAEAPPDAAPLLRETDRLVRATAAALHASVTAAGAEIARLGQGRRAASGYAGVPAPRTLEITA